MTYTLTQQEYSGLKSRLTRAKKKGPKAIVSAVHHAVNVFNAKGWPDAWATWSCALRDAVGDLRREGLFAEAVEAEQLEMRLFR